MSNIFPASWNKQFEEAGNQAFFLARFLRNIYKNGFEWNEFIRQCFFLGNKSFPLVAITGVILGFVLTVQSLPTMKYFGAESYVPRMVTISVIREVGPVIIALICTGKLASSIGAELGSMKVSEQIDAMNVSGANPMQYLVVTRILACTLTVPILTMLADILAIGGGYVGMYTVEHQLSFYLYINKCISSVAYNDLYPAIIKTFFFGFTIGFIGCYKGYNSKYSTESVGLSANSAVVNASLWIILIDAFAAQITNTFVY